MSQVLTEMMSNAEARVEVLSEDIAGGGKNMYMKGIFLQGGVKNHNKRVYPVNEISGAVNTLMEKINGGFSVLGEVDHPDTLTVNLDRVSHMITDMWMDGNCGMGKLKILPTPMGKLIETMMSSGVKLGVSSRGSGNVNALGEVSGFDIVTVDIVAQPSAPEAYPNTIYEGLWNYSKGQQMHSLAEAALHDSKAQQQLNKDIIGFIKDLKL